MPHSRVRPQPEALEQRIARDLEHRHGADRKGHDRLLSDLVRPVPVAGPEDGDGDGDEDDPADFGEPLRRGGGQ